MAMNITIAVVNANQDALGQSYEPPKKLNIKGVKTDATESNKSPRRKNNYLERQSEASAHFEDESSIVQQISILLTDTEKRVEQLSEKYDAARKDDSDVPFTELVHTNPMFVTHKDKLGRKTGVSQRTKWDAKILAELNPDMRLRRENTQEE